MMAIRSKYSWRPCAVAHLGRLRRRCMKSAAAIVATCSASASATKPRRRDAIDRLPYARTEQQGQRMSLSKIGVIGAGIMGSGIAQVSAASGLDVVLVDVSDEALNRGLNSISNSLDRLVKKEQLNSTQRDAV